MNSIDTATTLFQFNIILPYTPIYILTINLHAFLISPIRVTRFHPSNIHIIACSVKRANQESDHYAMLWSPYSFLPLRSKYSPQRWVLSLVMLYRCPNGGGGIKIQINNKNLYETAPQISSLIHQIYRHINSIALLRTIHHRLQKE